MSYFNPSQDMNSIFLSFQTQQYSCCPDPSKIQDLKLQQDLNFKTEQFSFHLSQPSSQNPLQIYHSPTLHPKKQPAIKGVNPRYQKNICGYILKKIIRAFISPAYREISLGICGKYKVEFLRLRDFCLEIVEKLNGISYLYSVFMPATKKDIESRLALIEFMEWFVKERYLRHLVLEGKMKNKESYIHFKNKLFPREISSLKLEIAIFREEVRGYQ